MMNTERLEQILQTVYHDELINTDPIITIDYSILTQYYPELADDIIPHYPQYKQLITNTINKLTTQGTRKQLKINNVTPITPINQIHNNLRNKLISTEGTIIKTSTVYNQITRVAWSCNDCGEIMTYPIGYDDKLVPPKAICKGCNHNKGYELDSNHCEFVSMQKYTLQENLEHVKRGFKPSQIIGYLEGSQVNTIKPGDKVRVTGIIELRNKNKDNKFYEYLLTENIQQLNKEFEDIKITPKDVKYFKEYAASHDMIEVFKKKVAPTLYGYDEVKEAITLQLFSTDTTKNDDGTLNRGDIHLLLIGDPGIGKSQILKSVVEIVPRGIYTSGKSSSGAGLTASAVKDENDSWTLEAGAMVLADKGLICIDEFDKMREADRSSIHEALEQQTISMAKAGNITTMYSRCSVLAAANPKFGSFDEHKSIQDQIKLHETLLSRFDLIFLLKDKKDREHDASVALSILDSTRQVEEEDEFEYKKYISYARKNVHPVEDEEASQKLVKFYQDWRETSNINDDTLPVTARQFMGITRLARASARARLSDTVTVEDVELAIKLEEYCINNTGYSVDVKTEPIKMVDQLERFWDKLPRLARDYDNHIPTRVLHREAADMDISKDVINSELQLKDGKGEVVLDPELQVWSLRDYGKKEE